MPTQQNPKGQPRRQSTPQRTQNPVKEQNQPQRGSQLGKQPSTQRKSK